MQYLNFEGRSDGRSIRTVLRDVAPRRLVLLSGSDAAKQSLKEHLLTADVCNDVLLPRSGDTVAVTTAAPVYRVQLRDALFHSLRFVPVDEDMEVAYVEGSVRHNPQQPNLPLLQAPLEAQGHPAVFLGQVRPTDLLQLLHSEGIQCEAVGGVLVCSGGAVLVSKRNDVQIEIQGALCDEYYRIRDLLYSQYQIC